MNDIDPTGLTILITTGEFVGEEGVCLGRSKTSDSLWAVSPGRSNVVLELRFVEDFGVVLNQGQRAGPN